MHHEVDRLKFVRPPPRSLRITTKWPARCKHCGTMMRAGSVVLWTPRKGVRHADPTICRANKGQRSS